MSDPIAKVELSPFLLELEGKSAPWNWLEVFGNSRPVELEVGSGKGLFLQNAAQSRPDVNFVGVELSRKYAKKAAERVAKRILSNVRVVPGDARLVLEKYLPAASLAAVHVYFPDPWWKARHKKRRVFAKPLVKDVERALLPGGRFWVVTDVEEYFGVMRGLMEEHPAFREQPWPEPTSPEHDLDYLTNFERKYRIEGRPIFRASYQFLP